LRICINEYLATPHADSEKSCFLPTDWNRINLDPVSASRNPKYYRRSTAAPPPLGNDNPAFAPRLDQARLVVSEAAL